MSTGLKRNTLDKFYTKPRIVKLCHEELKKYVPKNEYIIEPSAGNGAFIPMIKTITKNYKFYDIQPEHSDIVKKDFLETI